MEILQFEWDEEKAISNFEKHRITFSEARYIFYDPLRVKRRDDLHSEQEERWHGGKV